MLQRETNNYAVVGHPVGHSASPRIHRLFAQSTQQSLAYDAIDLPPGQLAEGVRQFFTRGGKGLNVTLPHKQAAMALVHTVSDRAQRAGCINTVRIAVDGTLVGDNTDGIGLVRDLVDNLQVPVSGRRILILGAGGAVRGILGSLLDLAPAAIVIANRTLARAEELTARFAGQGAVTATAYDDLRPGFDLVINGTAASLDGELPPLGPQMLQRHQVCYDLAYRTGAITTFQAWASTHGVQQVYDGIGMLVEQAAEAFWLWRGVRPQTAAVIRQLRAAGPDPGR